MHLLQRTSHVPPTRPGGHDGCDLRRGACHPQCTWRAFHDVLAAPLFEDEVREAAALEHRRALLLAGELHSGPDEPHQHDTTTGGDRDAHEQRPPVPSGA